MALPLLDINSYHTTLLPTKTLNSVHGHLEGWIWLGRNTLED